MLMSSLTGDINLPELLMGFLLSLPAFVLALSLHEAAHGYVALRCGDPTAKLMGRVTLNPLRHIDPMGFLFLMVVGVGWAKPVPVNPNNFRHPRRDDLLVSLAGIVMNLISFVVGCLLMYAVVLFALSRVPESAYNLFGQIGAVVEGTRYGFTPAEAIRLAPMMQDYLIAPYLGAWAGYLYEIIVNFAVVSLSLAVFNLLPMPPLDGYHVLNDLVLKRSLFADARHQRIGQAIVLLLVLTGLLSKGLSFLINGTFEGVGNAAYALMHALGVL